jgi:UDP-hydrolysing UDP-N-acetyl-D-glucosamine 2-epimerase
MPQRKICIATGTRAEYGLLSTLMKNIQQDPGLTLQIIATGMHLSPEFGLTYREIEHDGFKIDAKVEMLLSSDTPVGIAKSIGLGVVGFADAFERLRPDMLVLLGDRFELLAAAQAALVARIPVAHIAGGDTTEGAFDESIRHSITKMAHLHFVTNEDSARRVRQLGENPDQVHMVGNPGIDRILQMKRLSRTELESALNFAFRKKNLLVTFHPATLDAVPPEVQFQDLLAALDRLGNETGLLFTKPNADTGGRKLMQMIDDYVAAHSHAAAFTSLGQLRYFSVIAQVDAVVGNSSSGLYEVPSFKKPTVNIGDRQKGRLLASSVITCRPEAGDIEQAIKEAYHRDCSATVNPYGDGNSSSRIVAVIKQITDLQGLLKKHFYETGGSR